MKYRTVLAIFVLIPEQVNRNFQHVLNEMGQVGHGISTVLDEGFAMKCAVEIGHRLLVCVQRFLHLTGFPPQ